MTGLYERHLGEDLLPKSADFALIGDDKEEGTEQDIDDATDAE